METKEYRWHRTCNPTIAPTKSLFSLKIFQAQHQLSQHLYVFYVIDVAFCRVINSIYLEYVYIIIVIALILGEEVAIENVNNELMNVDSSQIRAICRRITCCGG
jgi:hypothetical protein